MADFPKNRYNPFWIIVIALLLILGILVLFSDVLVGTERGSQEHQPSSTEWTTKPEGGVEVNLPETPIVPVEPEGEVPREGSPGEGSPGEGE